MEYTTVESEQSLQSPITCEKNLKSYLNQRICHILLLILICVHSRGCLHVYLLAFDGLSMGLNLFFAPSVHYTVVEYLFEDKSFLVV